MVAAGTLTGSPARSHASRATLSPCVASGIAHPQYTSSIAAGSIPTRSIAAFIIAAEMSTACTSARAPSFLPRPTGLRTAETITTSFIGSVPRLSGGRVDGRTGGRALRTAPSPLVLPVHPPTRPPVHPSVPQWLPRLQHVLDSLLRLFRTQQSEKRLSLQVENVLLGHLARRAVAAGEDVRQLVRDSNVVVGDLAGFFHRPCGVLKVAQRVLSHRGDSTGHRRHVVGGQIGHARHRVGDQPIAVHRDAIGRS